MAESIRNYYNKINTVNI